MLEKTQEQRAAEELQRMLLQKLDGRKALDIAVLAYVQAAMANAALQGLIELLVHKNVISANELSAALSRGYFRAQAKIEAAQSPIIMPDAAVAKPQ